MEYDKNICPVLDVDGFVASGRQFDVEVTLPKDNRDVVYGVVKDECGDPIADAVVKLIEVSKDHCEEERKPVSHTFTDKDGEFVFGPLCSDRNYEVQIWANKVKHCKICKTCNRAGKCLKGVELHCPNKPCYKPCGEDKCDKPHDKKCEKKCDRAEAIEVSDYCESNTCSDC